MNLVVSSPLTRALSTALLAFRDRSPECPMVVHPGCRELGSGIPENKPRSLQELQSDSRLKSLPRFEEADFGLLPGEWPPPIGTNSGGDGGAKRSKKQRPKHDKDGNKNEGHIVGGGLLEWLRQQPVTRLAVVCHHNYITSLIGGVRVDNAVPIECVLDEHGIRIAEEHELDMRGDIADEQGDPTLASDEHNGSNTKLEKKVAITRSSTDAAASGAFRVFLVDKSEQKKGGIVLILPKHASARAIVDTALAKFRGFKTRLKQKDKSSRLIMIRRQSDSQAYTCDSLGCGTSAAGGAAHLGWLANNDVLYVGVASDEDLRAVVSMPAVVQPAAP